MTVSQQQQQKLDVVSALARGRSTTDVATRMHLSVAYVEGLKEEFGPDLGTLYKSAERLREGVGQERPDANVASVVAGPTDDIASLLARAADLPKLAAKAEKVRTLLAEIRSSITAAEELEKAAAIVAARQKELDAAKHALAALKSTPATGKTTGQPDAAKIRAWAIANGHRIGANGRIPAEIMAAYEAAAK